MKKGFALISVLAGLIVIVLGTTAILKALGSLTSMKYNNVRVVQAQYLAEAGMVRALWRCRTAGCVDDAPFAIGGTAVPIDVTSVGAAGANLFVINVDVDNGNVA